MQVKVYATLRPIVGSVRVSVETQPGQPVRALVDELVRRWPALRSELLDDQDDLRQGIHLLINGRSVRFLDGLDTTIPERAHISIFPPVGGG